MKTVSILPVFAALIATLSLTASAADCFPGIAAQSENYFYTGKPFDRDIGAYTFAHRQYSPVLNRWTTVDPSGFSDGANYYAYVGNAASWALDPNGLWRLKLEGKFNNYESSGSIHKYLSGGLGGYANFDGTSYASNSDYSGSVNSSWSAAGYAHLFDGRDSFDITPGITVNMDSSSGNLTYSQNGTFSKKEDSVTVVVSYSISGENSTSLTVHITVGVALNASTFSGGGANASGGSISFGGTSYSETFAGGDFHFTAVE